MGNLKIFIHYSLIQNNNNEFITLQNSHIIIYIPKNICKYAKVINNQICFDNINSNEFVEVNPSNYDEYEYI